MQRQRDKPTRTANKKVSFSTNVKTPNRWLHLWSEMKKKFTSLIAALPQFFATVTIFSSFKILLSKKKKKTYDKIDGFQIGVKIFLSFSWEKKKGYFYVSSETLSSFYGNDLTKLLVVFNKGTWKNKRTKERNRIWFG